MREGVKNSGNQTTWRPGRWHHEEKERDKTKNVRVKHNATTGREKLSDDTKDIVGNQTMRRSRD